MSPALDDRDAPGSGRRPCRWLPWLRVAKLLLTLILLALGIWEALSGLL